MRVAVYLTLTVSLSGCTGPLSALDPSGLAASSIATLWWVMLAGAVALFAMVLILFALAFLRPAWGRAVSPMSWIIFGGLVLPTVVLPPLVAYGLITGERFLSLPGRTPMRIEASAQQWHWTFRYPEYDGTTSKDVIHLPAGTPVEIMVTSRDVIHAFWIPRLAGKIDAIPGRLNLLRIQANVPGRYQGLCNEFCGHGHSGMRFDVVVHPASDFDAALVGLAGPTDVAK